jgi:alpha-glucosidase
MSADWWRDAVFYQVYPRSFADASGDGVGDLPGLIAHLDHLRGEPSSLGVDAIWISPFYRSPMADFGYDVSDHCDVDPLFGTMADFDRLIAEAHRRGLRVIVDYVPNHTSDQHPWFQSARSSREDPRRNWYVWRDPAPDGGPPNAWRSIFGGVPAWTFDAATGQYYLHSFLREQPDLNWEEAGLRAAMHDVLRFWLDRGVDGFRIDAAHRLGKDPELGDNPDDLTAGGARRRDEDWDSAFARLGEIRAVLDEYRERIAVGEVYVLDQRRLIEYVRGDGLQLVHNFIFLESAWSARAFRDVVDEFALLAGESVWPAWALGNHDHERVASRYDDDAGNGPARALVAATLLATLRGSPFLYQGEELGLTTSPIARHQVLDVDGRDGARGPMPWSAPSEAGAGAGFTSARPWLPVTPEAEAVAVSRQRRDPSSTLSFYRRLLSARASSVALRLGSYRSLAGGEEVFAYQREYGSERILVALNFASTTQRLAGFPEGLGRGEVEVLCSTHRSGRIRLSGFELAGNEALVVRA